MANNKVSVAMATYNGEKYLREQLDSLYSQTRIPDEIVVVDDRSTDGTVTILEEYHKKKGLVYIINETNLGVNRNFEKAIRRCTGDYIAICDQDDVWMSHKILTCLSKLQEIEEGMPACVSSQIINVNKELQVINKKRSLKRDTWGLKANLLCTHNSQGCTMMINRQLADCLGDFPKSEIMYDGYIGLLAPCVGKKYNISEPLMYYRHHETNVVGKIKKHVRLMPRIVNHLKMWKYDIPFYYSRFHSLEIIRNLHSAIMSKESLELIDALHTYNNSGMQGKLNYIWSEGFFCIREKIGMAAKILLTYHMPL